MKNTFDLERYSFASILLIFAAIILISMLEIPSDTTVSGVIVKNPETTSTTENSSDEDIPHIINLNTATVEQLDSLPGIGEVRAKSIIAYREYLGKYTSIEQIKEVDGFGDSIFNKIKDQITV